MTFTPEERTQIRSELLELATGDKRLTGVAITGSVAANREDRWSDIDLAFGVGNPTDIESVISDFTSWMCDRYSALHHMDVKAAAWTYRVFFLPGTLQVDLAFVSSADFRPLSATFKLVSGVANPLQSLPAPNPVQLIGTAWLHALHARSCILRGKLWQAEYMIGVVRDHGLMLACVRLGLPSAHGRGFDALPAEIRQSVLGSLVGRLEVGELWSALTVVLQELLNEVRLADERLAGRIGSELLEIGNNPC